jgi:uncharacterized membrane protein YhaH (DUF805 family)
MGMILLDWLALTGSQTGDLTGFGSIIASIIYLFMAAFLVLLVIILALYIYTSLAFMAIGKKAQDEKYWLAWIPVIGKPLLTSRIAKMSWWPILLLLGYFFNYIPNFGAYISFAFLIIFSIFSFIWMWKTFKAVGKPGWWVLLVLIPILGWIIYYILLGIAAWSKDES